MSHNKKQEVITFKVDEALSRAMEGIPPNRSEFIRRAILAALEGTCPPLCLGTGDTHAAAAAALAKIQ